MRMKRQPGRADESKYTIPYIGNFLRKEILVKFPPSPIITISRTHNEDV